MVSGESGSGKTEAVKIILDHIVYASKETSREGTTKKVRVYYLPKITSSRTSVTIFSSADIVGSSTTGKLRKRTNREELQFV